MLAALDYAHGQGVVHRDVKPNSILLDGGSAYLAGFGIAALRDDPPAASVVGTPRYKAPEQVRGERPDGRADLYACGVVLYQLLVGRPPYPWLGTATATQHVTASPPPPRVVNPALSEAVERVLARALAGDREARYPTGAALADALRAALAETDP